MNTADIIHNLNEAAISKHGIPNALLLVIGEALHERDNCKLQLFQNTEQDLATIKRQHSEIETLREERDAAVTHLRAIVDAMLLAKTADAIIDAERWLRKIDGEVTPK